MNRAWDEWVDPRQSADAGLHRRRARTAAYRGDRGDGGEVSGALARSNHASSSRPARNIRRASAMQSRRIPDSDAASRSGMTAEALNTPPSCSLPCWSAPDRDSSRSCRAARQNPCAPARRDRTGSPAPCASAAGSTASYSALPFRVMRRANSRRSSSFSTRSTSCRFISAVTARLMVDLWVRVQCAMYCALQASSRKPSVASTRHSGISSP